MSQQPAQEYPVVWVVNVAGHDYTSARDFGELRPVVDSYVPREKPKALLKITTEWAEGTHPDDWILPSGLMILNLFAVLAFFTKHGTVNLLLWSPDEGYTPFQISPDMITTLFELKK